MVSEVNGFTHPDVVDALLQSAKRSGRDLERVIPTWEAVELRQRACDSGLPIAEEQGMSELVFLLTDVVCSFDEDLTFGWRKSAEKRAVMEDALAAALAEGRRMLADRGLTARALDKEVKTLIDAPPLEVGEDSRFEEARANYIKRRDEYIIEYGALQSHIYARQHQLQLVLNGFLDTRGLARAVLEFRSNSCTTSSYGRGAGAIALCTGDLTTRGRAAMIVALVAGQLAMVHHDAQIVHSLIDRVNGNTQSAPKAGTPLSDAHIRSIMDSYRKKTGGELFIEFLNEVAAKRKAVLNVAEIGRADNLARSFNATKGMTTPHEIRAQEISTLQEISHKLRSGKNYDVRDLAEELLGAGGDGLCVVLFNNKKGELPDDSPVRRLLDEYLKPRAVTKANGKTEPLEGEAELTFQIGMLLDERAGTLKELHKRAQQDYLQNLHARESVIFGGEAYTQSVTRLAGALKYTGEARRISTGMEDACVHHEHTTFMDLHGMS